MQNAECRVQNVNAEISQDEVGGYTACQRQHTMTVRNYTANGWESWDPASYHERQPQASRAQGRETDMGIWPSGLFFVAMNGRAFTPGLTYVASAAYIVFELVE